MSESLNADRSVAESKFIDEMARKMLVSCADFVLRENQDFPETYLPEPYASQALKRGWLSKRNPRRLTGKGYEAAASYLRR